MKRNELLTIAQRLREYVNNSHHVDPMSDAFKALINDAVIALSKSAEHPPAVGGEPPISAYVNQCNGQFNLKRELDANNFPEFWDGLVLLCDHRAHVAPLLAEIDRLKADLDGYESGEHAAQVADELGYQLLRANARIAELEAGQGEAVAWMVEVDGMTLHHREPSRSPRAKNTPLYLRSQPAKAKVVLPERCDDGGTGGADYYIAVGWNACLDTTAKLNGGAE